MVDKEKLMTFTFEQVQYGYWGQTVRRDRNGDLKRINVKASSLEEAKLKVSKRKDYYKHLRNGDYCTWFLVK